MRRPDENYDWNNAIGKGVIMYGYRGGPATYGEAFVLVHSVTAKSFTYLSRRYNATEKARRKSKDSVMFVEATEADYKTVCQRWNDRESMIKDARIRANARFKKAMDELCEND